MALIFVLLTASFAIADKMTGDVNQRELTGIVNEMASDMVSDPDEFDEFDDGIYFVRYNNEGIENRGNVSQGI